MMMKVIIFSLKADKGIYAFTIDKEYAEIFRSQRNIDLFNETEISLNKYEYMVFNNKNSHFQLVKDYLDDGDTDIEIVATINETTRLSEYCEQIRQTSEFIERNIDGFMLKKKYLKAIMNVTQNITKRKDNHPTLNINTFKLFYYLFRNTFSEYWLPNSQNLKFLITYDEE